MTSTSPNINRWHAFALLAVSRQRDVDDRHVDDRRILMLGSTKRWECRHAPFTPDLKAPER